jgi:carbon-monoxide dehydrogenase iron sulfur subunit
VEGAGGISFPMQCRQCIKAPCLDACLSGALTRDAETHMVVINDDRCVACWTCTLFCPYGVIYPWPERKMAIKCDRCNYMEYPVCVDVCPTKALELLDVDDLEQVIQKKRRAVLSPLESGKRNGLVVLDLKSDNAV